VSVAAAVQFSRFGTCLTFSVICIKCRPSVELLVCYFRLLYPVVKVGGFQPWLLWLVLALLPFEPNLAKNSHTQHHHESKSVEVGCLNLCQFGDFQSPEMHQNSNNPCLIEPPAVNAHHFATTCFIKVLRHSIKLIHLFVFI